jgi:hypothetical protein
MREATRDGSRLAIEAAKSWLFVWSHAHAHASDLRERVTRRMYWLIPGYFCCWPRGASAYVLATP